MTDSKPIYRSLVKKRSELPPTPTPASTSTPPTQSEESEIQSSQSEIGFEGIDEYVNGSVPATKPLSNSGWDVADLLKEWRLDGFT